MLQKSSKLTAAPKAQVTGNKDVALMGPGRWRVAGETGLYLWVSPDGQVRRWIFRFTSPVTKRPTETGLDLAPAVSLADAKGKAQAMRKQIANGICPIAAKRAERASQVTFREAAEGWIEIHKSSWKGRDTGSQMRNATLLLFTHGKPLADKAVSTITPDMVQAALNKLWPKAPVQARRALGVFESVLDFAKAKGSRQGDNPCAWKGMHEYRFPKRRAIDRKHHAALDYQQMPAFMKALRVKQERSKGALALEFLILTVARTDEVLSMTWAEIDFEQGLWNLPPERTKQGRTHSVPLSDRAMQILNLQKQYASRSEFVFTGYKRTRMAERVMMWVLKHMGEKATVHGMRSVFRDWAGDLTHFARNDIEECLGHAVGNAVERAYRRSQAIEKRRVILEHWASYCAGSSKP
jgi:integrase